MKISILYLVLLSFLSTAHAGTATVIPNRTQWEQHFASVTAIDFTGWPGVPVGRTITEQYSHLGVHFTDGNDFILNGQPAPQGTYIDGSGLHSGNDATINIAFDVPQMGFGVDFPGVVALAFFRDNQLVHQSPLWGTSGPLFIGMILTTPFDRVQITTIPGHPVLAIDNIYFAVPGPGALGVFALATLSGGSRRRRS